MRLVLDADALIKLNRIGVLALLLTTFPCTVPATVYREVVEVGSLHGYEDASAIAEMLEGRAEIVEVSATEAFRGLGVGDEGILEVVRTSPDSIVVGDDRILARALIASKIGVLSAAGAVVLLARESLLSLKAAERALEALRPGINLDTYSSAKWNLDRLR